MIQQVSDENAFAAYDSFVPSYVVPAYETPSPAYMSAPPTSATPAPAPVPDLRSPDPDPSLPPGSLGFPFPHQAAYAEASFLTPNPYPEDLRDSCNAPDTFFPVGCSTWMPQFPSPGVTPPCTVEGLLPLALDSGVYQMFPASEWCSETQTLRMPTTSYSGDADYGVQTGHVQTETTIGAIRQPSADTSTPQTTTSASPRPSPSPSRAPRPRRPRSRQPSSSCSPPPFPPDHRARTAHNLVERHYRRRLNAQFAALQQALPPALRADPGEGDGGRGGKTAKRVRKAEVLELARRYIGALEAAGAALRREQEVLAGRLRWAELAAQGGLR